MRFLADESCDFAIVRTLREAGHDVLAVRDSMPGATDSAVIERALSESRILLTEDKDFGQLVFASAAESPGVIFMRYSARTRQLMAQTVMAFIERKAESIPHRFVVVQPGRVRISPRPKNA